MGYIFISYSKHDQAQARSFRHQLETISLPVWMDEARLEASDQWWDTIEASIQKCEAFLLIMSESSRESRWVKREFLLADELRKPIFPVLINGEPWALLGDIQFEDLRSLENTLPERLIMRLTLLFAPSATDTHSDDDILEIIRLFYLAREDHNWDMAQRLLDRISASKDAPKAFDVQAYQREVSFQSELEIAERKRRAAEKAKQEVRDKEYKAISLIANYETQEQAWKLLQNFWEVYGQYDPQELADKLRPTTVPTISESPTEPIIRLTYHLDEFPQPNYTGAFGFSLRYITMPRDLTTTLLFLLGTPIILLLSILVDSAGFGNITIGLVWVIWLALIAIFPVLRENIDT